MVRMTDLLKKVKMQISKKEELPTLGKEQLSIAKITKEEVKKPPALEEKEAPPVSKKEPAIIEEEYAKPTTRKKEETPAVKPVVFSDIFLRKADESLSRHEDITSRFMRTSMPDEEEIKKLYFESIASIRKIFNGYKDGAAIDEKEIMDMANKLVNNIMLGSRTLLKLFHESDSLELYIYYNAVNVAILSIEIATAYNHNKSSLINLAVIGLLHDMGLMKNKDIIDTPKKLADKELNLIKQHPLNIAAFVDNALKLTKEVVNGILQHHERQNGQGYPTGLTDVEIQDLAEIVGIADTYESMTHSRPYKEKMTPHAAILDMINKCKNLFPNELIKALVSRVGLYPTGSWVQLNTGEICKVLETSPDFPLRPVISILMDKDKRKFREIRTLDLQKTPSLYIKNVVEKTLI